MTENGALERLVKRCRGTGVVRRRENRWVAGVCAGLAQRWGIDPVLIRVGFILLSVFGAIGVAVYLLCWLLLPAPDGSVSLDRALRRGDSGAITLLVFTVLITIGSLTPGRSGGSGPPSAFFGLVVVGLFVWWLARTGKLSGPASPDDGPGAAGPLASASARHGEAPVGRGTACAAETPRGTTPVHTAYPEPIQDVMTAHGPVPGGHASVAAPSTGSTIDAGPGVVTPPRHRDRTSWFTTLLAGGLALLAYLSAGGVLVGIGVDRPWITGLAAALGVLGVTLVITAFTGHRAPLVALTTWLIGISLVSSLAPGDPAAQRDELWRPTTASEIHSTYEQGVGRATLDLTAVPIDGARTIKVSQGVGELTILLPGGTSTHVTADRGPGTMRVQENGRTRNVDDDGLGGTDSFTVGSGPSAYDLDISGGVGDVVIRVVSPATTPRQEALR